MIYSILENTQLLKRWLGCYSACCVCTPENLRGALQGPHKEPGPAVCT